MFPANRSDQLSRPREVDGVSEAEEAEVEEIWRPVYVGVIVVVGMLHFTV